VAPYFRVTGPTIEEAANRSQKNTYPLAPFVVCNHVLIHHPDFKQWDMQGVIVEVGKHSDYFNQNPNWPHILTQPAISLPLRPNIPIIHQS
jgi:hypothetical protein